VDARFTQQAEESLQVKVQLTAKNSKALELEEESEIHICARKKQRREGSKIQRKLRKHGDAYEELLSKSQKLH